MCLYHIPVRKCARLGKGGSNQTSLNNEHPSEHELSPSQIDCHLNFSAEYCDEGLFVLVIFSLLCVYVFAASL